MNEWRSCLISFLSNYPIGKEITASNHRGEKQFRQDYFLLDKPPSRQEHLDCLLVHQNLFNIRLILTIPWLLCLSAHIFRCPASISLINLKANPQQWKTNVGTVFKLHSNTEFRWAFPLRYLLRFDCHLSTKRESGHQPAWRFTPAEVPCFLNVELIQETERHGGWLVAASHLW